MIELIYEKLHVGVTGNGIGRRVFILCEDKVRIELDREKAMKLKGLMGMAIIEPKEIKVCTEEELPSTQGKPVVSTPTPAEEKNIIPIIEVIKERWRRIGEGLGR